MNTPKTSPSLLHWVIFSCAQHMVLPKIKSLMKEMEHKDGKPWSTSKWLCVPVMQNTGGQCCTLGLYTQGPRGFSDPSKAVKGVWGPRCQRWIELINLNVHVPTLQIRTEFHVVEVMVFGVRTDCESWFCHLLTRWLKANTLAFWGLNFSVYIMRDHYCSFHGCEN